MKAQGVELLAELDRLAVMGFAEVVRHLPFFWGLEHRLKELMDTGGIDLVLPVDYPGFNLRAARSARRRGIPVLYYIAPQVWAWKPGRARRLAEDADRIAVILPFEEEIFRAQGGRVSFVGHPLLEEQRTVPSRIEFAHAHGLDPEAPILALFPGSRRQEIRRHLEIFLQAARRVRESCPTVQVVVARASSISSEDLPVGPLPLVDDGWALLCHARAALVKSGTTTLEAALAGTPFVTAYRTHPLTFFLARRLVRVPHVALANLVVGERVVPEVLQEEATPARLAGLLLPLLQPASPERALQEAGLARVRLSLGPAGPGAAHAVAQMAAELLAEREAPGWSAGGRD